MLILSRNSGRHTLETAVRNNANQACTTAVLKLRDRYIVYFEISTIYGLKSGARVCALADMAAFREDFGSINSLSTVARYIRNGHAKNIVVMVRVIFN